MKFTMEALQPRQKIVLFIICAVITLLLFYFIILEPQRQRITELRNELQLERARINTIEAFVIAHPNSDKYLIELDQKTAQIDKMFPNQPEISDFLSLLNQTSKSCGVQLVHVKPAASINKSGYREIPLDILIRGNYFQTLNFLTKMESLPRLVLVTNITTQSKQRTLETKLSAIIYSYGVTVNQKQTEPAKK